MADGAGMRRARLWQAGGRVTSLSTHVLDIERGYLLAPMHRGIRLTTGAEFAQLDAPRNESQIDGSEAVARQLLTFGDRLDAAPWIGARPATPDMKPIIGRAPPEGIIESVVREHFGERGVRDVWVQPFDDYDGGDSLRVTVVLDPATAKKLDGETAIRLIGALRRRLEDLGEERLPVVEYATRDEIERLAVEA